MIIFRDDREELGFIEDNKMSEILDKKADVAPLSDKEAPQDLFIFTIGTTSDKKINRRMYPDEHVKDTVSKNKWLVKYNRPFIEDHKRSGRPLGRVIDNYYVAHHGLSFLDGKKFPEKVLDFFKSQNCFDEGTGSVILKVTPSDMDTVDKFKDGTLFTTSQSSASKELICNICGDSIFSCRHWPGEKYKLTEDSEPVECVPKTGALEPIEDSTTSTPANDTSISILYDSKKDEIILPRHLVVSQNQNTSTGASDNISNDFEAMAKSKKFEIIRDFTNKQGNDTMNTQTSEIVDEKKDKDKIEGGNDSMDVKEISKQFRDTVIPLIIENVAADKKEALKTQLEAADISILQPLLDISRSLSSSYDDAIAAKTQEIGALKTQMDALAVTVQKDKRGHSSKENTEDNDNKEDGSKEEKLEDKDQENKDKEKQDPNKVPEKFNDNAGGKEKEKKVITVSEEFSV